MWLKVNWGLCALKIYNNIFKEDFKSHKDEIRAVQVSERHTWWRPIKQKQSHALTIACRVCFDPFTFVFMRVHEFSWLCASCVQTCACIIRCTYWISWLQAVYSVHHHSSYHIGLLMLCNFSLPQSE